MRTASVTIWSNKPRLIMFCESTLVRLGTFQQILVQHIHTQIRMRLLHPVQHYRLSNRVTLVEEKLIQTL